MSSTFQAFKTAHDREENQQEKVIHLIDFSSGYMASLNQRLCEISILPMAEQRPILKEHFDKWKGNLEQVDDVCIIGIKL